MIVFGVLKKIKSGIEGEIKNLAISLGSLFIVVPAYSYRDEFSVIRVLFYLIVCFNFLSFVASVVHILRWWETLDDMVIQEQLHKELIETKDEFFNISSAIREGRNV